jgi:glycosyltransferase involved in cell wall biosynthesis
MPTPCLLIAPQGLTVTGVTTWMVHAARGLAAMGRPVAIVAHGGICGHEEIAVDLPESVPVIRPPRAVPIDDLRGSIDRVVALYRGAALTSRALPNASGPVALFPTRHGDCFAACAQVATANPDLARVAAVQHIDGAYESSIIERYEPALSSLGGVSSHLVDLLRTRFPHRADDVVLVRNATTVPDAPPARSTLTDRPLRILYTGRIEHEQKRIGAVVRMSVELDRRAVPHELVMLGDGPASAEIDSACAELGSARRLPPVPPAEVPDHLAWADVLVMASRTEGLSLSLLEAMAHGVAPVITETPSGARDAIDDGEHGVLVPCDPDEPEAMTARRLADGIKRVIELGVHRVGRAAHQRARDRFTADHLARTVAELADRAAAAPAQTWPADKPVAFSAPFATEAGSGSVPPGGVSKFRALLETLAGRRVIIHGTGAHTRQLSEIIDSAPCVIAGFADDDPGAHGSECLGHPVVAPERAHTLDATDVVISTAIHENAVYARREAYERQGLAVHRVYAGEPITQPASR